MSYSQVRYEGHAHSATIYVTGMLGPLAAARAEHAIAVIQRTVRTIRVDLRGVSSVEPDSFIRLARALSAWHDRTGGQITIAFPSQSEVSVEHRAERKAVVLRAAAATDERRDPTGVSARFSRASL